MLFFFFFFFFNDTATTEIYTLSLHDALPILEELRRSKDHLKGSLMLSLESTSSRMNRLAKQDRKSTRLNSSHVSISYAVFCLKKKKNKSNIIRKDRDNNNHKLRKHELDKPRD